MAERPTAAMVLSVIGGLFIILIGAVILWIASLFESLLEGLIFVGGETLNVDPVLWIQILGGVFGVAFGLIILIGGIVMFIKPGASTAMGVIILILSLASVLSTGGLFIGMILGLVGGILGIVFKPSSPMPAPRATPPP